ncbi:hypothetical protein GQ53DRAFT_161109 [Thozetella sp. PMI_491]|nr:hypothetical protein GQ53DRAFT_161109 [Thozetella sp. PMI_491]
MQRPRIHTCTPPFPPTRGPSRSLFSGTSVMQRHLPCRDLSLHPYQLPPLPSSALGQLDRTFPSLRRARPLARCFRAPRRCPPNFLFLPPRSNGRIPPLWRTISCGSGYVGGVWPSSATLADRQGQPVFVGLSNSPLPVYHLSSSQHFSSGVPLGVWRSACCVRIVGWKNEKSPPISLCALLLEPLTRRHSRLSPLPVSRKPLTSEVEWNPLRARLGGSIRGGF